VHGEGRLKTPLRRVGAKGEGRFERISWAQALDIVHERFTAVMAAHGPQAILPLNYAGPHGLLAGGSMDLRFFHRLGSSLLGSPPSSAAAGRRTALEVRDDASSTLPARRLRKTFWTACASSPPTVMASRGRAGSRSGACRPSNVAAVERVVHSSASPARNAASR